MSICLKLPYDRSPPSRRDCGQKLQPHAVLRLHALKFLWFASIMIGEAVTQVVAVNVEAFKVEASRDDVRTSIHLGRKSYPFAYPSAHLARSRPSMGSSPPSKRSSPSRLTSGRPVSTPVYVYQLDRGSRSSATRRECAKLAPRQYRPASSGQTASA
jgi:hypothetical protein